MFLSNLLQKTFGSTKDYIQAPFGRPLPLPFEGSCTAGTKWTINSLEQLYNTDEHDCIWAAGITPGGVPLGRNYGSLLSFADSTLLTLLTPFLYQGDYTYQTRCGDSYQYIGVLYFGGVPANTGFWSINEFPWPFPSSQQGGEYYDGKAGILMDFSTDTSARCGADEPIFPQGGFGQPFFTGSWPMRQFIDLLQWVGCDEADGGHLLLGRTWMLDATKSLDEVDEVYTVLYFVLKTFDDNVLPAGATCGMEIELDTSFTFSRGGLAPFLKRLNPLNWIEGQMTGTLTDGIIDYPDALADQILPWFQQKIRDIVPVSASLLGGMPFMR
eukprot:GHVH01013306.1.p1 GENE.GHVH01013306.1~~GHVH01013306.1.p1  ORF type:complete len:327 (-),score=21.73 GHVH01013306.1:673-1653(-)